MSLAVTLIVILRQADGEPKSTQLPRMRFMRFMSASQNGC
jgi:hypothetical protein